MNTSSYKIKHICIGNFKHHYGGSFTRLRFVGKNFHNSGFLKQVYVTYESMLEMVPNNVRKSG